MLHSDIYHTSAWTNALLGSTTALERGGTLNIVATLENKSTIAFLATVTIIPLPDGKGPPAKQSNGQVFGIHRKENSNCSWRIVNEMALPTSREGEQNERCIDYDAYRTSPILLLKDRRSGTSDDTARELEAGMSARRRQESHGPTASKTMSALPAAKRH